MARTQTGADVKDQFKPLSEADIRAYTDEASFDKGYSYYLKHAIVEPTLGETALRAFCHGSSVSPYRVEVSLIPASEKSSNKLADGSCTCPRGSFCKHLVALLLTWLHHPEQFEIRTGLMGQLKEKSREELLVLMEQLLQRQPDIEPLIELLIELPVVTTMEEGKKPGKDRGRTVDPFSIRSQVTSAFYKAGEGWEAASRIADELYRLCEIGSSFAEAGQWANAQVVYTTIAQETISQYEEIEDEAQISGVISECAAGLAECLDAQSSLPKDEQLDAEEREELFTTLFDLWKFGHDYGEVETDIPDLVARNVTEDERRVVEAWLREEMRSGQDFSSQWHNRRVIDFLAVLKEAVHFSDEDLIEEYRKAGLYKELTEKLLELGRENEALNVAKEKLTEPMDITRFAELLLKSGIAWREQALTFVENRLKEVEYAMQGKPQDYTRAHVVDIYRRWLVEKYSEYGKAEQALNMALVRFQASPDDANYRSVRSAARLAGQPEGVWSTLRPRLIQTLEQQGKWWALVNIYLDEGQVGQAISALAEMERPSSTSPYGYSYHHASSPYQVQVAKAAEEQYPDEAIRLYKSAVEKLIASRGRENYQQAISHLARVMTLYQKQGHEAEWNAYITNLRNSNKNLRALREELDKRGM